MNYGIAENEIVTRLNAFFLEKGSNGYFVAALMPETEQEAKDFEKLFPKSRVAVERLKSEYAKNSSLQLVTQSETVTFRLLFEGKVLRGEKGLYAMMEQTKLSLIGFKLSNSDELTVSSEGKEQFESGVWLPYIDFECKTMNVQAFDPSEAAVGGALVGLITPNDQFSTELESSVQ